MAALQYVEVPGYAAILFRRTYTDLALPGALMDMSHEWLAGTAAHWNDKSKTWEFPSGATLSFGYLDNANDKFRYQSAEFQFIGFDELTQFEEKQYLYLFSRLRKLKTAPIPLRMRAASNPGGIGHEWVAQRFIFGDKKFIPASLYDNTHIDRDAYIQSLMNLDAITRERLLNGDWNVRESGNVFEREWFHIVDSYPHTARRVRYWDLAATEPKPDTDPDYTAGVLMAEDNGIYYVIDVKRDRKTPFGVEQLISRTAEEDGRDVDIFIEQEPGSSGKNTIDHYCRTVLKGYPAYGHRTTGSKEMRAKPVSAAAEAGNIRLVRGSWIPEYLNELEIFPYGKHDDQVDATSGAFEMLATRPKIQIINKPKGW